MSWREANTMSLRKEFVQAAQQRNANIRSLCRQYSITPRTAYKWLKRYEAQGEAGLEDQSRRPRQSPQRSGEEIEAKVIRVREIHASWGGRKIRRVLQDQGVANVPAASTITEILRRHEHIDPQEAQKHRAFQRFEREQPNELWQMDFKGRFLFPDGKECHPLTVLDDHSRFLIGLRACPNQKYTTVQEQLTLIFREYGLPERMLMDNGSPWGDDSDTRHTILTAWLLRLGIAISHGRPYHPQTQGKDERLHRTLNEEVILHYSLQDLFESQQVFDQWRHTYNCERPHEALQLDTPASRYEKSSRSFPETLPPITYEPNDIVRKVDKGGKVSIFNHAFRLGKPFRGQLVGLRPLDQDGLFAVFYCKQQIKQIDLHKNDEC